MEMASLASLVAALTAHTRARVCIQDVTGDYSAVLSSLPKEWQFHEGPVCMLSKDTRVGMGLCTGCKFRALDRARLSEEPYVGLCIYGLSEVVCPVFHHGRLSCIIFVGNLLENPGRFAFRVRYRSRQTGVAEERFLAQLPHLCPVENGDYSPYLQIALLLRSYIQMLYHELPERQETEQTVHRLVSHVAEYIELYYREPLPLRALAANHYVSENYLGRLFKREMHMTIADYLHYTRIRAACALLRDTEENIGRVAEKCGYDTIPYFNRIFRRLMDLSPSAYRRRYR